jgi:hypothetical protein
MRAEITGKMGEPTCRYFLTFPWATMTREGSRREVVGRREEEKAELQGSEEAHDGDAIAPCVCVRAAATAFVSYPLGDWIWCYRPGPLAYGLV